MEHVNEDFDKIWLLQKVTAPHALTSKCIDESHSVLQYLPWTCEQTFNQDRWLLIILVTFSFDCVISSFLAVKQIVVLVGMDHKFDELFALHFCQTPSQRLQSRTDPNLLI